MAPVIQFEVLLRRNFDLSSSFQLDSEEARSNRTKMNEVWDRLNEYQCDKMIKLGRQLYQLRSLKRK